MRHAIGFGALNLDLIYEVPRELLVRFPGLEPGGEIFGAPSAFDPTMEFLSLHGRLRSRSGGGSAANTMVALSRMGFDVGYTGKVGGDEEGCFLLEALESVDRTGIRRGERTGVCVVLLDEFGERSNIVFPNANDTLSYDEIDPVYAQDTRILHLTSFAGDAPFHAQRKLVSKLPESVRFSFDPGELYARRGLRALMPILKRTEILFATGREVERMTGEFHAQGVRILLTCGPRVVVCKLGAEGAYLATGEEEFSVPSEPTDVVDSTGAGDVFAAGFLAGLLLNRPLRACAQFAAKAAARSVSGYGRERYPDRAFLEAVL